MQVRSNKRSLAYNALAFELRSLKMLKDYSFIAESPEPVTVIPTTDTHCLKKRKKKDRPTLNQEVIPGGINEKHERIHTEELAFFLPLQIKIKVQVIF